MFISAIAPRLRGAMAMSQHEELSMQKELIAGYTRFRDGYFQDNRTRLDALAEGQSLRICLVSCCDSRVDQLPG